MKKRSQHVLVWSVVGIVVVAVIVGVFIKWGMNEENSSPGIVPPAGWVNYQNSDYGFSLSYPPDWQISTSTLENDVPSVVFGNPIEGTTTYTLRVSVEKNIGNLSSAQYVMDVLTQAETEDETNGTSSPSVSAQFASSTAFAVDQNAGYELDNVFEFDHNAEQIYVAHGGEALIFDFPVADVNPNIASSTENNIIAHQILGTLSFTNTVQ
jgi:hypothetical protein